MSSDCILPFNDYYNHYLHIEDKKEKKNLTTNSVFQIYVRILFTGFVKNTTLILSTNHTHS